MSYRPGEDPFFILREEFNKLIDNTDKDYMLFGLPNVRVYDQIGNVVLRIGGTDRMTVDAVEVFSRKGFIVPLYKASSPMTSFAMANLAKRHGFFKKFGKRLESEIVRENVMKWNEIIPDKHAGLIERLQLAYAVTEHDMAGVDIPKFQAFVDCRIY